MRNWEEIFGSPLPATVAPTRVGEKDLANILQAAYVSDSDLALLPYRIVVVTDGELICQMGAAVSSDAPLSCSLVLIVAVEKAKAVNDLLQTMQRIESQSNSRKQFDRYQAPLSDDSAATAWIIGLAAQCAARITLAARALGHTATTLEIFAAKGVRRLISAADDVEVPFIIAIGGTVPQRLGRETPENPEPRYCLNNWGNIVTPKLIQEEARYHDSLVSYFDILGFRSAVEGSSPEEIESVLRRMASLSYHDTRLRMITRRGLSTFSDHVVRTVALEGLSDAESAEAVEFELSEIQLVQANLAAMGTFLRGGITRGPIYIGDEFVFGPALVEAYELEHTAAKYPRIVLHDKLRSAALSHEHLALHADDGMLTLNYLAVGDDVVERLGFVKLHARIVTDALAEATKPEISEKLRWLATFHNQVVSKISDADLSQAAMARAELIIPVRPS